MDPEPFIASAAKSKHWWWWSILTIWWDVKSVFDSKLLISGETVIAVTVVIFEFAVIEGKKDIDSVGSCSAILLHKNAPPPFFSQQKKSYQT